MLGRAVAKDGTRRTFWPRARAGLAALALVASLGASARVGVSLLGADGWLTPPRSFAQEGAAKPSYCGHRTQVPLQMIVDGERAWVVCTGEDDSMPRGGLLRLEPALGVARGDWPIPAGGPELMSVRAALVGPDGRLGLVYRARDRGRSGGLAVAVATDDGWSRAPAIVDGSDAVLGLAWVDGALEVAVRSEGPPEDSPAGDPFVLRVASNGEATSVSTFARASICGELGRSCKVYGAYRPPGAPWRFVMGGAGRWGERRAIDGGGLGPGVDASEGGQEPGSVAWLWTARADGSDRRAFDNRPFEGAGRDMSVAGMPLALSPAMTTYVLQPDGTWADAEGPPSRAADLEPLANVFAVRDGHQHLRLRWTSRTGARRRLAREIDGRWISVVRQHGPRPTLSVDLGEGTEAARLLARSVRGAEVFDGVVLERTGGGYYLATPEAYLTFDDDGRRVDPLPPSTTSPPSRPQRWAPSGGRRSACSRVCSAPRSWSAALTRSERVAQTRIGPGTRGGNSWPPRYSSPPPRMRSAHGSPSRHSGA